MLVYQVVEVCGLDNQQACFGNLGTAKDTVEELLYKRKRTPCSQFRVYCFAMDTPPSAGTSPRVQDVTDGIVDVVRKEVGDKYTPVRTAETINALGRQSDALRKAILDSADADELSVAYKGLESARELWVALAYGYKFDELERLVRVHANDLIAEDDAFLAGERKNSRLRRMTENNIAHLKMICGLTHI